jgi:hypothetical protein
LLSRTPNNKQKKTWPRAPTLERRGEHVPAHVEEVEHQHAEEDRHHPVAEADDEGPAGGEIEAARSTVDDVAERARLGDEDVPFARRPGAEERQPRDPLRRGETRVLACRPDAQQHRHLAARLEHHVDDRHQQQQDRRGGEKPCADRATTAAEPTVEPLVQRPGADRDQARPADRAQGAAQQVRRADEERQHGRGARGLGLHRCSRRYSL